MSLLIFVSFSNRGRISQFRASSSLAHCPVSGSDTICNCLCQQLIDVVLFEFDFIRLKKTILNTFDDQVIEDISSGNEDKRVDSVVLYKPF